MKKIINKPEDYVKEMLEGLYIAHPDLITYTNGDVHCLVTAKSASRRAAVPDTYRFFSDMSAKECSMHARSAMYFKARVRIKCSPVRNT